MKCLVLMPFAPEFDDVFQAARAGAVSAIPDTQLDCYWLKDTQYAGRITDDILHGIQHSAFCIADLTGNNPNVMWETGYAMASGKPTILIGQSIESIPFDLKVHRILPYTCNDLGQLTERVRESVRQTLAKFSVAPTLAAQPRRLARTISVAVTGTSDPDPLRTKRRVEDILRPYIDRDVQWYCGTVGVADEIILEFLISNGKVPIGVGYNSLDISPKVRGMLAQKHMEFVDASVENTPRDAWGSHDRDVLFANRTDLVILFWDGASENTKRLITYYQTIQKNLIIGFI